jgi:hypothetical protein
MRLARAALVLLYALQPAVSPAQRIGGRISPPAVAATVAPDFRRDSIPALRNRIHLGPLSIPRRDSSWWVPLASGVMPGAGQALLGQDRFIGYVAMEAYALLSALDRSAEERLQTHRYQSLALDVARAFVLGNRPVGNWPYYESMEKYIESGVFNAGAPGGDFTPETDVTTYNGFIWLDVRQRWWTNPYVEPDHSSSQYRNAFNEYLARAYRPEMRWSWRNAQLEQDNYRQIINLKNQVHHDATTALGVLAANHLLSMIDAFVTVRLRGGAGAGGTPSELSLTVPWAPFGHPRTR